MVFIAVIGERIGEDRYAHFRALARLRATQCRFYFPRATETSFFTRRAILTNRLSDLLADARLCGMRWRSSQSSCNARA